MKLTGDKDGKIALFGFLGLVVMFLLGAGCVVLMPFALLYAVVYLVVLLIVFVRHLIRMPDTEKEFLRELADFATTPEVIHQSAVRRRKKRIAKQRKRQVRRRKKQARRLTVAYAANRALRDFIK